MSCSALQAQHIRQYHYRLASTQAEREAIYKLRYAVYVLEQGKSPTSCDHNAQMLYDTLDENGFLFYVEQAGSIIATVRLNMGSDPNLPNEYYELYALEKFCCVPKASWSFSSRLIVSPRARKTGILLELVKASYQHGQQLGSAFDFIHCADALVPLFQRMGYRHYQSHTVQTDVGTRTPMLLLVNDVAHLQAVSSPFLSICSAYASKSPYPEWIYSHFQNALLQVNG